MLALVTPYTAGSWSSVRKVQAEKQATLLHGSFAPQTLAIATPPTASAFASFILAQAIFTDGPYLDPPTDGTSILPALIPSQGVMPVFGYWDAIIANGAGLFVALDLNTAIAASSTDGLTWTQRVLPVSTGWTAVAWNGTVFCAIAGLPLPGTTIAATSPDGITWTQRVLPIAANWVAITWNGTVFCAIAQNSAIAATSPDGITWTQRVLPVSAAWSAIASNGTVFCAVATGPSSIAATSTDGITWTQRTLPTSAYWSGIAWNGTVFCTVAVISSIAATSTAGVTWTQRVLPSIAGWSIIAAGGSTFCTVAGNDGLTATSTDGANWTQRPVLKQSWAAIAWNGTVFTAVADGSSTSIASTSGTFSTVSLTLSSPNSVNSGVGFMATDVRLQQRPLSEPPPWFVATAYVAGNAVKFNGIYFIAIASSTGSQPDISPAKWTISSAAATWTWGTIISITSATVVVIAVQGANLLYLTPITIWRLGLYSTTTSWPTCCLYYQQRPLLPRVCLNPVDSSVSNQIFNFAPTGPDGTVAGNNAISYIFNADGVNPIFWMLGNDSGILCGTQVGEWLIFAPTTGPITPTNIKAHRSTTYGSANIDPQGTQLTIAFVQRFNRKMLEYSPDALAGRYTAPNLAQNAKHLTKPGIAEIRYQQEASPVVWSRMTTGEASC